MKRLAIYLTITAFTALITGGAAYPITPSEYERRSGNGSTIMAPGYLNVDKQRSESMKESVTPAATTEERIKEIDADLDRSMFETQPDTAKLDLKKKTAKSASPTESALAKDEGNAIKEFMLIDIDAMEVSDELLAIAAERNAVVGTLTNGNTVMAWGNVFSVWDAAGEQIIDQQALEIDSVADGDWASAYGGVDYNFGIADAGDGRFAVMLTNTVRETYTGLDIDFTSFQVYDTSADNLGTQLANNEGISVSSFTSLGNGYYAVGVGYNHSDGGYITFTNNLSDFSAGATDRYTFGSYGSTEYFNGIAALGDGKFALCTGRSDGTYVTIRNSDDVHNIEDSRTFSSSWNPYGYGVIPDEYSGMQYGYYDYGRRQFGGIVGLDDGTFAIAWDDDISNSYGDSKSLLNVQVYSDSLEADSTEGVIANEMINSGWVYDYDLGDSLYQSGHESIYDMKALNDGTILLAAWGVTSVDDGSGTYFDEETINLYTVNPDGTVSAEDLGTESFGQDAETRIYRSMSGINVVGGYRYSVDTSQYTENSILDEYGVLTYEQEYATHAFGAYTGEQLQTQAENPEYAAWQESLNDSAGGLFANQADAVTAQFNKGLDATLAFTATDGLQANVDANKMTGIFEGLLANKDALILGAEGVEMSPELMAKLLQDALQESGLVMSAGELTPQEMEIAMLLTNILTNPTAEQKVILDAMASLMNEIQKMEEESGGDPELAKAQDDFTQMVATALLAQALPGLLKEGDVSSIKGIFGDLNEENSRILLEYRASAKVYYDNVVKELAANIATLQIKDLLSKELTERELEKLPTQRIDEIVRKIKEVKDKTITEEQILKVEAKYKEEYLAPAKRTLEENMKTLLQGFTKKIFGVLDGAGLVKENMEQGKPTININLSAK